MSDSAVRVFVRDWVSHLGALQPADAARLAKHVIDKKTVGGLIILDFRDAGAVSSSFANELFVTLAHDSPLDDWRSVLKFSGLAPNQAEVLTKSLRAARRLDPKP